MSRGSWRISQLYYPSLGWHSRRFVASRNRSFPQLCCSTVPQCYCLLSAGHNKLPLCGRRQLLCSWNLLLAREKQSRLAKQLSIQPASQLGYPNSTVILGKPTVSSLLGTLSASYCEHGSTLLDTPEPDESISYILTSYSRNSLRLSSYPRL